MTTFVATGSLSRTTRATGPLLLVMAWVATQGAIEPGAHAADLRLEAPDGCVEADSVREQVDGLLGRPLARVEGVDFEVAIAPRPDRRWGLRLVTIDKLVGSRRTRELAAKTCAELADAAAVAITMSIKSTLVEQEARRVPAPAAAGDAAPAGPSPSTVQAAPQAPATSSPPRKAIALAALVDAGAMPRAALGLALEASLQLRSVRLVGSAAWFSSQQVTVTGVGGGDFQLAVAGALGCLTRQLGRVIALGCLGGEAGRLSGEGVGVSQARARGTLWLAARGDIGAAVALGPGLALVLRGGAALPLYRPTFLLDNVTAVHRPSSLTARATVAVELAF